MLSEAVGDKKDFMYYMIEFGSLKRKEGEYISDFSKRFNKMYNKIPVEIKPSEVSANDHLPQRLRS
jgi:hypothetical protein